MTTLGAKFTVTLERPWSLPPLWRPYTRYEVTETWFADCVDWLIENALEYAVPRPKYLGDEIFEKPTFKRSFRFRTVADATLFKLRWGGQ